MIVQTRCPICSTTAARRSAEVMTMPGSIAFRCTRCRSLAVTPDRGEPGRPPASAVGHPESPPSGPPFDPDDLIVLHELLCRDDWFARLAPRDAA